MIMIATTVGAVLSVLQGLSLFILSDLRARIVRLENRAIGAHAEEVHV